MAQLSSEARAILKRQLQSLGGGFIIQMKTFTRGRFRLLPLKNLEDPTPGVKYIGVFCKALNKGTTSLRNVGLPCPAADSIDAKMGEAGAGKEEKQRIRNIANMTGEHWAGVVDRNIPQSVENAKINVLPVKTSPYKQLVGKMADDDISCDLSHPTDGQDFLLQKEGSGATSEYKIIDFCLPSPLDPDPDVQDAILKKWDAFSLEDYVHRQEIKWDVIEHIYKLMTGEESVPAAYNQSKKYALAQASGTAALPASNKPLSSGKKTTIVKPTPAPVAPPEEAEPADDTGETGESDTVSTNEGDGPDENGVELGVTLVKFTGGDGNEVPGVVTAKAADSEGNDYYTIRDADQIEWDVYPASLTMLSEEEIAALTATVVEDEPTEGDDPTFMGDPGAEDEPELVTPTAPPPAPKQKIKPAPPAPKPAPPAPKVANTAATAKPASPKPAATLVKAPATPLKPAATAVKTPLKPATTPVKAPVASPAGKVKTALVKPAVKASDALRNRLNAAK